MDRQSDDVSTCGSLTAPVSPGDHRRAASARRRATLLIMASMTASLATASGVAHGEELESRRLRSVAVPSLQLGAALTRLQAPAPAWSVEAFARLSWPLDALGHSARDVAARASRRRDHL